MVIRSHVVSATAMCVFHVAPAWAINSCILFYGRVNMYKVYVDTQTGGKLLSGRNCHVVFM